MILYLLLLIMMPVVVWTSEGYVRVASESCTHAS